MAGLLLSQLFLGFSLITCIIGVALLAYLFFFYVDCPKIEGLPEPAGGDLLSGHFHHLGNDHATTAERWARENGWPVFQMRMGPRRAIVLNSFQATKEWIVKHQSATLDRPWFPTFHGVVSATSAPTIGTSPWDERTKKQRRVVGSLTTGPSIQNLRPLLDLETSAMVAAMFHESSKGDKEIMPHIYQKRLALNMMMMFCYGRRFSSVNDTLLHQILADASIIASYRSTIATGRDFIPHLRWFSSSASNTTAKEVRARRDQWLANLLEEARAKAFTRVGSKTTVAEMLLAENQDGLTELDIRTILGGLMSGGFETVFSTAIITIGQLSTEAGQLMQQRAYEDIMSHYDSPEHAFEQCLVEEKSSYVMGLVKEALRFYPPLKLLPARQTFKEFVYNGATIPKGVLVYINAQAANRDKAIYGSDADQFKPERWQKDGHDIPPPYHFAFGAGARMCTAVNFSNRLLYAMFVRMILAFQIKPSKMSKVNTDYIHYKQDPTASNAIASDFFVRLIPRDGEALESCLKTSKENIERSDWAGSATELLRT